MQLVIKHFININSISEIQMDPRFALCITGFFHCTAPHSHEGSICVFMALTSSWRTLIFLYLWSTVTSQLQVHHTPGRAARSALVRAGLHSPADGLHEINPQRPCPILQLWSLWFLQSHSLQLAAHSGLSYVCFCIRASQDLGSA